MLDSSQLLRCPDNPLNCIKSLCLVQNVNISSVKIGTHALNNFHSLITLLNLVRETLYTYLTYKHFVFWFLLILERLIG